MHYILYIAEIVNNFMIYDIDNVNLLLHLLLNVNHFMLFNSVSQDLDVNTIHNLKIAIAKN